MKYVIAYAKALVYLTVGALAFFALVWLFDGMIKDLFPPVMKHAVESVVPKHIAKKLEPKFKEGQCIKWCYEDEFTTDCAVFEVNKVGKTSYLLCRIFDERGPDCSSLGREVERFSYADDHYVECK